MKRKIFTSLLFLLLLLLYPLPSANAAGTVPVTLPGFSVTLSGQTTANDYSAYPLLVYQDITYFPMTYYDCRLLGLGTDWSAAEGLSVYRSDRNLSEYVREVQTSRNSKNQRAEIAQGKITVNGKGIDNSREQYPLLLFRDVTYFPLTWRFAVEEFGWDYHFDNETGLTISNPAAKFTTEEALPILDEYAPYEGNEDVWEWAGRFTQMGGLGLVSRWLDLKLPCVFGSGVNGDGRTVSSITIYNFARTEEEPDIVLLPSSWEYRVYRVIQGRDELVYRQAIPFYSGTFPNYNNLNWTIHDHYWDSAGLAKGVYRVELVHPEEFAYETVGGGERRTVPIREYFDDSVANHAVDLTYSHTVTIR